MAPTTEEAAARAKKNATTPIGRSLSKSYSEKIDEFSAELPKSATLVSPKMFSRTSKPLSTNMLLTVTKHQFPKPPAPQYKDEV